MVKTVIEKSAHGFSWIDIQMPTADELSGIASAYSLHENLVRDCLEPDHLPKYEKIGDSHFIIVRHFDREAHSGADSVQAMTRKIAVFYSHDYVIMIHRAEHAFLTCLEDSISFKQGNEISPFRVLCSIIGAALETYGEPLDRAAEEIERFEEAIFSGKAAHSIMQEIFVAKRRASVMGRMIHMTLETLYDIEAADSDMPALREVRDTADRQYFYASQLQENITNVLSLQLSLASFRTNEVMRVLTLFSVFFMPLTFIAGVYGMNFMFMPELRHPFGYPLVLGIMIAVSLTIFIWFRKKRWI